MSSVGENGNKTGNWMQTEQVLRASELSYRRLFEAARDGILILDADIGRIMDVNPYLVELLGFSHDEMIGKTVGELSPFRDCVFNQAMLERLQKDGFVLYHDLPLETRDGRHIAVEFVSNVCQAGDSKVIQCHIRDITERKLAEDNAHQLSQAVEQSPVSVIFANTKGKIEYMRALHPHTRISFHLRLHQKCHCPSRRIGQRRGAAAKTVHANRVGAQIAGSAGCGRCSAAALHLAGACNGHCGRSCGPAKPGPRAGCIWLHEKLR
jgi:PAS domain S-box-containing protein